MKQQAILTLIFCLVAFVRLVKAELPDGSKGTLELKVEVQDELGIDTISQVVELEHIQASEIEPFINARLSRWGAVQVNDALNMVIITDKKIKVDDLIALVKRLDSPKLKKFLRLETIAIPLDYTDASTIKSLVTPQLSTEGSMVVDNSHNALVITDVKSKIDAIKRIIGRMDIIIPQVVIEVSVVEVSGDYLSKVGLDWSVLGLTQGSIDATWDATKSKSRTETMTQTITETKTGGGTQIDEGPKVTDITETKSEKTPYTSWKVSGYFDLERVFDFINLLVNENQAKILTKTKIVTTNNEQAEITAGEKMYYRPLDRTTRSGEEYYQTTGLTLRITPRIGKKDVVTLDIYSLVNNLTGWSPEGMPIVISRTVDSKVILKDGETFVLGGFEKTTKVETDKGIPVLRSILPFLFSRKVKSEVKSEIVIFLTPHIKRELGYAPEEDLENLQEE